MKIIVSILSIFIAVVFTAAYDFHFIKLLLVAMELVEDRITVFFGLSVGAILLLMVNWFAVRIVYRQLCYFTEIRMDLAARIVLSLLFITVMVVYDYYFISMVQAVRVLDLDSSTFYLGFIGSLTLLVISNVFILRYVYFNIFKYKK